MNNWCVIVIWTRELGRGGGGGCVYWLEGGGSGPAGALVLCLELDSLWVQCVRGEIIDWIDHP